MLSTLGTLSSPLLLLLIVLAFTPGCGSPPRSAPTAATQSSPVITPVANSISAQQNFSFHGATYPYWVFTPSAFNRHSQLPVVLLLHGGGGHGLDMIGAWQSFASQQGIILVAPTFPYSAQFETTVPQLFPQLMDAVRQSWNFDAHHVYVFGVSAGGYLCYDAATLVSTYFTAVGVFAAIITPDYDSIVTRAVRKTPVAIYIGDHDQFFTLAQTRSTRDLLLAHGFPVHYVEFPNLGHDYGAVSAQVNQDFWSYASSYALP